MYTLRGTFAKSNTKQNICFMGFFFGCLHGWVDCVRMGWVGEGEKEVWRKVVVRRKR